MKKSFFTSTCPFEKVSCWERATGSSFGFMNKKKADINHSSRMVVRNQSPAMSQRLTTGRSFPLLGKSASLNDLKYRGLHLGLQR
jgi:hypothetical protein